MASQGRDGGEICKGCGAGHLTPESSFCPKCGQEVERPTDQSMTHCLGFNKKTGALCHRVLAVDDDFCSSCGTPQDGSLAPVHSSRPSRDVNVASTLEDAASEPDVHQMPLAAVDDSGLQPQSDEPATIEDARPPAESQHCQVALETLATPPGGLHDAQDKTTSTTDVEVPASRALQPQDMPGADGGIPGSSSSRSDIQNETDQLQSVDEGQENDSLMLEQINRNVLKIEGIKENIQSMVTPGFEQETKPPNANTNSEIGRKRHQGRDDLDLGGVGRTTESADQIGRRSSVGSAHETSAQSSTNMSAIPSVPQNSGMKINGSLQMQRGDASPATNQGATETAKEPQEDGGDDSFVMAKEEFESSHESFEMVPDHFPVEDAADDKARYLYIPMANYQPDSGDEDDREGLDEEQSIGEQGTWPDVAREQLSSQNVQKYQDQTDCTFHVMVSKKFGFKHKKHIVLIRFGLAELGGWHSSCHRGRVISSHKGSHKHRPLVEVKVQIPVYLMGKEIKYCYYIWNIRTGKTESESFPLAATTYLAPDEPQSSRTLRLKKKDDSKREWHQYDAVLIKAERLLEWRARYVEYMWKEMRKALASMLPGWQGLCPDNPSGSGTAQESLAQLEMVYICFRENCLRYYITEEDRVKKTEHEMNQVLHEYLSARLACFRQLQDYSREHGSTGKHKEEDIQLTAALAIVKIAHMRKLRLKDDDKAAILKALGVHPDGNGSVRGYETLKANFREFHKLAEPLCTFLSSCTNNPAWVYAIPLLHFVSAQSAPGQTVPLTSYHKDCLWWGTDGIENEIKTLQDERGIKQHFERYLKNLEPMFEIDLLLPRTLMAIIGYKNAVKYPNRVNKCLPPETYLANMTHDLESVSQLNTPQKVQDVKDALKIVSGQLSNEMGEALQRAKPMKTISMELVQQLCQKVNRSSEYEIIVSAFEIAVRTLSEFEALISRHLTTSDKSRVECQKAFKKMQNDAGSLCKMVTDWQNKVLPKDPSETGTQGVRFRDQYEIKITNSLLTADFGHPDINSFWSDSLLNFFKFRLEQFTPMGRVELFCQEDLSNYNQKLVERVLQVALDAVGCIIENKTSEQLTPVWKFADNLVKTQNGQKLKPILSVMLRAMWPHETTEDKDYVILEHMLRCPHFPHFLRTFLDCSTAGQLLDEECHRIIAQGLDVIRRTVAHLINGTIKVYFLEMICETDACARVESLIELQRISETGSNPSWKLKVSIPLIGDQPASSVLKKVIQWRKKERDACEKQRQQVDTFLAMCDSIRPVDTGTLREKVENPIDNLSLEDLCARRQVCEDHLRDMGEYNPQVIYFSELCVESQILQQLHRCKDSLVFKLKWQDIGRQVHDEKRETGDGNETLNYDEVVQKVWRAAHGQWLKICDGIRSGDILLADVDTYFRDFEGKAPNLITELNKMGLDDAVIGERLQQIKQYHSLNQYQRSAEVIMEVHDTYKLKGDDYDNVQYLSSRSAGENRTLRSITPQVLEACNIVKDITEARATCLEQFCRCKPLVDWLHELEGKAVEAKTLVNHAEDLMQVGDDLEEVKVKSLQSVVSGYGPLIFELPETNSFQQFIALCELVWRDMDVDEKLPEKLSDTCRQLKWLKEMKDAVGEVEVTTMAQVEAVNSRGIYQVGCLHDRPAQGIADAIELVVPSGAEGTTRPVSGGETPLVKKYKLSDVRELGNKMMLITAKSNKEQGDKFVEVLEGITRLANVYMDMGTAGSILFTNWRAIFYCQPDRPVNCSIDFGLSELKLLGYNDSATTVAQQIVNMCRFMEDCHQTWVRYVEEQRRAFYNLNYFTTQQLVMLRRELAKLWAETGHVQNHVYSLLHSVQHDTSEMNLKMALQATLLELKEKARQKASECPRMADGGEGSDAEQEVYTREQVQQFIDQLTVYYPDALAYRALQEVGCPDIAQGLLYCMDHGKETDEEADIMAKAVPLEQLKSSLLEQYKESERSLKAQLEGIWTDYMGSATNSLTDFLSVQHLGLILDQLAKQRAQSQNRPFLAHFKAGRPNLRIVPQAEMYLAILELYCVNTTGDYLPLPQADEVLLCNAETTAEEVELLFYRAVGDTKGKVYCLANADLLAKKVAGKTEALLSRLVQENTRLAYRLVIICSQESENSYIVNALDHYRVSAALVDDLMSIQMYLKDHFKTSVAETGVKAAAHLDPMNVSVRLIKSNRAGVGKSLKIRRIRDQLPSLNPSLSNEELYVKIPLHRSSIDVSMAMAALSKHFPEPGKNIPRIFHIDLAHEVQEGVDFLLFNLLVLGSITDRDGTVWRRSPLDLYLVENMPVITKDKHQQLGCEELLYLHQVLGLLPSLTCWSPLNSLHLLQNNTDAIKAACPHWKKNSLDQLMDEEAFRSETWQRPCKYLHQLDGVKNQAPAEQTIATCIERMLRHCGIQDPSWAELGYFAHFLNIQMEDYEACPFLQEKIEEHGKWSTLPGFRNFVTRFMVQMSQDFATRSLELSEHAVRKNPEVRQEPDLAQYAMKRKWESSPHPYVFFNADHESMTFLGFKVTDKGDVIDPQSGKVLAKNVLPRALQQSLAKNGVNLKENFDSISREEMVAKMFKVMGLETSGRLWTERLSKLDDSYVLTSDNVKKILAIYMRFRCNIPVIVMGETGCGKTRLVKFLCDLQKPPGQKMVNMILAKVHSGTTEEDITAKVMEAADLAKKNRKQDKRIYTVLFFDEANTTEAIGMIKEIMCDNTFNGAPLPQTEGLKIVAACNPYRMHSKEVIQRLEKAGLGYRVQDDQTKDKLGQIPMRQLVYRVQPLPQAMLPLVWDFGTISKDTEKLYIKRMVGTYLKKADFEAGQHFADILTNLLTISQEYMRTQQRECSFVSLRDVERVLMVIKWFFDHTAVLRPFIDKKAEAECAKHQQQYKPLTSLSRSVILALGVCYNCRLEDREQYLKKVAQAFQAPCDLGHQGHRAMADDIRRCQEVFLEQVKLPKTIARNSALQENFFMMAMCIELGIPLFMVGKPGSSKSLAKTVIVSAMEGDSSPSPLFKKLKSIHMVSYQCSQVSTSEDIVSTFKQCAGYQKEKNLNEFTSVVVLDEVGLAEDSNSMPLKTLHPLLEDGCIGDEKPEAHKKVSFIGLSNWALDPAKMNRGIFVQRRPLGEEELVETAKQICNSPLLEHQVDSLIRAAAAGYLKVCQCHGTKDQIRREFFGLRDYYSLIKALYKFAHGPEAVRTPTWHEVRHAILRNFGGIEGHDPLQSFDFLNIDKNAEKLPTDPDSSTQDLILASIRGPQTESRYLLILTLNYAALRFLQKEMNDAIIIFGSSFPKDQEYTQLCRNVNLIKMCMAIGKPVVLLKLEDLYESLYDALNQYYFYLFGQRFVHLGLGMQRVPSKVHKDFKLVVVAEQSTVLKDFPIPLINRLEKQFLSMATLLSAQQRDVVAQLETWTKDFVTLQLPELQHLPRRLQPTVPDVFVGFSSDTCASVVIQACSQTQEEPQPEHWEQEVREASKTLLLQCATPDAVLRLRQTRLRAEEVAVQKKYFETLPIGSLEMLLKSELRSRGATKDIFLQVTTHSRLLSQSDCENLAESLALPQENIVLETLHDFDTQQQFSKCLRQFYMETHAGDRERILIVKCYAGDHSMELINCARYHTTNEYTRALEQREGETTGHAHVVFVVQLPRKKGGCYTSFQGGQWLCYHVDGLFPHQELDVSISVIKRHTISSLFKSSRRAGESATHSTGGEVEDGERSATTLDVGKLVYHCLHQALVMVRDPPGWGIRKTKRLNLLAELLKVDSDSVTDQGAPGFGKALTLPEVLQHRLALLLEEKEKYMSPQQVHYWQQAAVSFETICKAGTCRRALRQYLEKAITPLLAGLIAFIDTNANLDILQEHKTCDWLPQVWLHMLRDPRVTPFTYSDIHSALQSDAPHLGLKEFPVRNTACEGVQGSTLLPFSWILKSKLEELLNKTESGKDRFEENAEQTVMNLLCTDALGAILEQAATHVSPRSIVNLYAKDFVQMVYHPHAPDCSTELQLVREALESASMERQIGDRSEPGMSIQAVGSGDFSPMDLTLVGIHLTYSSVKGRLQLFSQLVQTWPEVVERLQAQAQRGKGHTLCTTEMTLDMHALLILLNDHLSPLPKDDLNNSKRRQDWLEKVEHAKPVVEELFATLEELKLADKLRNTSMKLFQQCRLVWSKICAVRLFAINVCPPEVNDAYIGVSTCGLLWGLLYDKNDFKTKDSLQAVEKFLGICHANASAHYFGKESKDCKACKETMQNPVKLPCEHISCLKCLQQQSLLGLRECPQCKSKYPKGFSLETLMEKRKVIDAHNLYKQRCDAFFMEFVSSLCFGGKTSPEPEVMQRLMDYVTHQTVSGPPHSQPQPTLQDTYVPPTEVRSFLLQHMLHYDTPDVELRLQEYFNKTKELMRKPEEIVQLCILFVYCLEDKYDLDDTSKATEQAQVVGFATSLLSHGSQMFDQSLGINKLKAIAGVRYGLRQTAHWLYRYYVKDQRLESAGASRNSKILGLFQAASKLVEGNANKWPRLFLMRMVSRTYGMDTLQTLAKNKRLKYLFGADVAKIQANVQPDYLAVYGPQYTKLRNSMTQVLAGDRIDNFKQTIKAVAEDTPDIQRHLLLAVFREVTCGFGKLKPEMRPSTTVIASIEKLIEEEPLVATVDKALTKKLLRNKLGGQSCAHLTCQPTTTDDIRQQWMLELGAHLLITGVVAGSPPTAAAVTVGPSLLQPLLHLMTDPGSMKLSYLPAMPQDNLEELRKFLRNEKGWGSKPTLWLCPNGHPYVIDSCGKPTTEGKCKQCGAAIGGQRYQSAADNVRATEEDMTACGHCLGPAEERNLNQVVPERKLSAVATTVLRMLLHLALLHGASRDNGEQAVKEMITPKPADAVQFVWQHLLRDLELLSKALGHSAEDCCLLMHLILKRIAETPDPGMGDLDGKLSTKPDREAWEKLFNDTYIAPALEGLSATMKTSRKTLVDDDWLGKNPLLEELYEVGRETQWNSDYGNVQQSPAMWHFRSRINIDHLAHMFHQKGDAEEEHPALQLFLRHDHHLRALQYLPSVIKLQHKLIHEYNCNITYADARDQHFGDFLKIFSQQDHIHRECKALFKDFAAAWDLVREDLRTFGFAGYMSVDPKTCGHRISEEATPIGMLVPSTKGLGLCSLALTHFLIQVHNSFVEEYIQLRGRGNRHSVAVQDVTKAHLVAYHPQLDLMPVLLANCKYSLTPGGTTTVEYDFAGMERMIEDRFIKGHPKISTLMNMEEVTFLDDFTDVTLFEQLCAKIPQVSVPQGVQLQSVNETHDLLELNDSLATIDIAIGFLSSVGGARDGSLVDFVTQTLRMSCSWLERKAGGCQLQHVKSLWLHLSHERAKLLMAYGQDPFDHIDVKYQQKLSETQTAALEEALQHVNLRVFILQLYQCIVLNLTVQQNPNDENYVPNAQQRLCDVLAAYISCQDDMIEIPALTNGTAGHKFPAIEVQQCIEAWKQTCRFSSSSGE